MKRIRCTVLAAALPLLLAVPAGSVVVHVPADQPSIQAGLDAAAYGDTVLVECGTYYEYELNLRNGVTLAGASGEAGCVVIDAMHAGRVANSISLNAATRVEGITFKNGFSGYDPGGGICCEYSETTFSDVAFVDNVSYGDGGGMYCLESAPVLQGVEFTGNAAYADHSGGGLSCYSSSPSLQNVTFTENEADVGGGMHCHGSSSSPTLTDVVFRGNSAERGGGMICGASSSPLLNHVLFDANSALLFSGGLHCNQTDAAVLDDVVFTGNTCSNWGGGMGCDYASPTLTNVTFGAGNAADRGGGMVCWNASPTLIDVTFAGCSAEEMGGGMCAVNESSPTLERVTFALNSADLGGGMYCAHYYTTPTLTEVTFWQNVATVSGGALHTGSYALPALMSVTMADNSAGGHGGGVYCEDSSPSFDRVIIAFSSSAEGIYGAGASFPFLECSDVFGNSGGEYGGVVADQTGLSWNLSCDPYFCDLESGVLTLCEDSPCLPANHPGGPGVCGLIGAWGVGCPPCGSVPVLRATWGSIKAMYR